MPIFRRRPRGRAAPHPPAYDPAATQPLQAPVAVEERVYEEPLPPGPPRERLWPWLLLLLALLLLGIGIGVGYALSRDDGTDTTTTTTAATPAAVDVPDVIGRPADVAASQLVDAGLKPDLRRKLSKEPAGIVIEQDPAAAASVAPGSKVLLTISRGVDTVAVPALTGLTLQAALDRLRTAGLEGDATRVASQKPEGQVVAQVPGGGRELKKGAVVKLDVSKGAQPVQVPDVVGQPRDAATTSLEEAGLKAAVREVPSSKAAGTVIAQSPPAGERARKGAEVQINVSAGRATTGTTTTTTTTTTATTAGATVTVPDLVGSTFADAKRQLAAAGLKADRRDVPSTEPFGNVVAQFPAAGATAKRGGSIRVNVSKGPPVKAVPDVVGLEQTEAEQKLRGAGFAVTVETQDTTDPAEDGVVLDQVPSPGEQRKRGAKVTITVGVLTAG